MVDALSLVDTALSFLALICYRKQIIRFASELLAFINIGRHQSALFAISAIHLLLLSETYGALIWNRARLQVQKRA